jgi:hypothetical protein
VQQSPGQGHSERTTASRGVGPGTIGDDSTLTAFADAVAEFRPNHILIALREPVVDISGTGIGAKRARVNDMLVTPSRYPEAPPGRLAVGSTPLMATARTSGARARSS